MTEQARTPKGTNFRLIGIIVIIAYLTPWIIIAIFHWMNEVFISDDLSFILYIMVCGAGWATSFHLWSRVPKLEGRVRKLFRTTGFTFLVLVLLFTYLLLNVVLPWLGLPSINQLLNDTIPAIAFTIFDLFYTTMPADSLVTFAVLLLAIAFYLFAMERYARQKFPWHTLSMFICTALIPILVVIKSETFESMIIMSIGTVGVVLIVLYNFLFLFYLYFSLGRQAPEGSPLRKASFMIGFGFLCIILTWIVQWAIPNIGDGVINLIIQMSFGAAGIILFNYGFYLIRPA